MNHPTRMGLLGLALTLAACSTTTLEGDKVDYKSAVKGTTLEVPPDLTQLSRESRYTQANSGASAAAFQNQQVQRASAGAQNTAPPVMGDVRIERDGNQRWLVVNRSSDVLWEPVRAFWLENGFTLASEHPKLGIMETDWAENRAKLPQDIIRSTIGKVFESLYSTGERDKFRTRLERSGDGRTEIYISHRGMEEVYSSSQKDATIWQPRAIDPELETEFLRRLMVKLGVGQEEAKTIASAPVQRPATASAVTVGGAPAIELNEAFDRSWRRVGLSLDRTGFTVEDRDRSQGVYFVRYVDPGDGPKKEPGFFSKMFSRENTAPPLQYRIAVQAQGAKTTVLVQKSDASADTSANAQRIIRVLLDDLK